jgi:hypothetical protein
MPLPASVALPKATSNTTYTFNITDVTTVENSGERSFFSARRASINPPSFTVSGTVNTSGGTTTITAALANGFANVQVGDAITTAPGNTSGATVASTTVATKADNNTITLTDAASADGTGATSLSIDPGTITPTLYAIKEVLNFAGPSLTVEVWIFEYDGSLGSTPGSELNETRTRKVAEYSIDAGAFLDTCRVVRSNQDSVAL